MSELRAQGKVDFTSQRVHFSIEFGFDTHVRDFDNHCGLNQEENVNEVRLRWKAVQRVSLKERVLVCV